MGAGHDSKASTAVITAIVVTTVALEGQPVRLPVYGVRHTLDAVRVDGKLDEATWAMSPRVGEIRLIHDPTHRPAFPTEATMAWDDTNLYVAFASNDPVPWGRLKDRDARLWEEEVVEVFLDPDGDGRNYAERGFHDPERFGYIQFMPPGNAAVPGGAKEP
jgi:Carbohydrate family 9 binding domain-like